MKIDRVTAIRQLLFAKGHLSIAEIADAVGASEPTVRRDLALLEMDGAITRTHGGARIADASAIEIEFESREQIHLNRKRAIGEAAYARIRPGSAIFLDAGTTVLQVARLIRLRPMPLRIFTNCLPVAQLLMPVPDLTVTLLGGTLRMQNASMVGAMAEAALADLWFDQLFLGVGAIAPDGAIYSADDQEARINRQMLQRTSTKTLLADSGKFGLRLTHKVVALSQDMRLITDDCLTDAWRAQLADIGLTVALAATE
jgi:DeoR family fructose operon transcriptional repressor